MNPQNENLPDAASGPLGEGQTELIVTRAEISHWDGPLPSPEAFQSYENTLPGAAERLLTMVEEQHRQQIDEQQAASARNDKALNIANKVIIGDSWRGYLGIVLGFIIAMTGLCGGIFLAAIGRGGIGLTFGLASLVGLAGVFVYGAQSRRAERRRTENSGGE